MKVFCVLLLFSVVVTGQEAPEFEKRTFSKDGFQMPYRILLPKDFDKDKKYPLILFLHGSGERGNDNEAQLVHGSSLFTDSDFRKQYPAIVVFPQCASESSWAQIEVNGDFPDREFIFFEKGEPTQQMVLLEGLLKYLKKTYRLDKNRMYVGGLSMGGIGTFELVRRNPKMFAAAFPICGGANPAIASKLKRPVWWVFHGDEDKVVPEKCSADIVTAMGQQKVEVKYTVYPGVGHNSWDNAFAEPDLMNWLFAQTR